MGLFDKLKSAIDTATDAINKSIESAQNSKDPLSDLTVKKYFEIICGMRHTFLSSGVEAVTGNEKAKNYVEHFLGCACDVEKLEKTLELYNLSRDDHPTDKEAIIVSDFRKSLRESTKYTMDRYEACKLFCKKEIDMVTIEYNKVLDVIKDNINYDHFMQGLKRIKCDSTVKDVVIYNSFVDNNPITRELMLTFFVDSFTALIKNDSYSQLYDTHDDIAKVVLKALYFEKHGQSKEGYTSITDDEYYNFVINTPYYSEEINDHPFDKDEFTQKFIKLIKESEALSKSGYAVIFREDYYCDLACNYMWKTITQSGNWIKNGEDISNSTKAQDVFDIICNYFKKLEVQTVDF